MGPEGKRFDVVRTLRLFWVVGSIGVGDSRRVIVSGQRRVGRVQNPVAACVREENLAPATGRRGRVAERLAPRSLRLLAEASSGGYAEQVVTRRKEGRGIR